MATDAIAPVPLWQRIGSGLLVIAFALHQVVLLIYAAELLLPPGAPPSEKAKWAFIIVTLGSILSFAAIDTIRNRYVTRGLVRTRGWRRLLSAYSRPSND
ncbi:hypothetical protein [Methylobacterium sp. GC_Met_2]|uniref:hypothetical protein n=1 Tax=Methylobacterium sp. GC_Met_2 TaxID=2937376 RepID=UPI00226B42BE|nr:hypothetical protein [Methylobacterium sp. GC_Met_2]